MILALALIILAALGVGVSIYDRRTAPERRLIAGERRLRWEANRWR